MSEIKVSLEKDNTVKIIGDGTNCFIGNCVINVAADSTVEIDGVIVGNLKIEKQDNINFQKSDKEIVENLKKELGIS